MKLAFGIFKYFPHGGLQRDMMRIAAEAVRRGHRVTVYAISAEGEIPAGVKLELLPVSGWMWPTSCRTRLSRRSAPPSSG